MTCCIDTWTPCLPNCPILPNAMKFMKILKGEGVHVTALSSHLILLGGWSRMTSHLSKPFNGFQDMVWSKKTGGNNNKKKIWFQRWRILQNFIIFKKITFQSLIVILSSESWFYFQMRHNTREKFVDHVERFIFTRILYILVLHMVLLALKC